jgi:hypothetical protein
MQNITQLLDVVDNMVPRFVYKKKIMLLHTFRITTHANTT